MTPPVDFEYVRLSKEELKILKTLKKRGSMEDESVALSNLKFIKPGKRTPDGVGGSNVDYYVISDLGVQYLRWRKTRPFLFVWRFLKPVLHLLASNTLSNFLLNILIILTLIQLISPQSQLQSILQAIKEVLKSP